MADQDLEYRIKIDTSDLSSQLAQVRSQIDQALAASSFNATTPPAQAASFQFPMPQIGGSVASASQIAQADFQSAAQALEMSASSARNLAQATALGFQKFNDDIRTAALMRGGNTPILVGSSGGIYPSFADRGFIANAMSTFGGFGFEPSTYSMTPGEFSRMAGLQVAHDLPQAATTLGFGLGGSAIGGAFGVSAGRALGSVVGRSLGGILGPVGAIAGGIVFDKVGELAYDTAAATVLSDYTNAADMRNYAYQTSWRYLSGRFSFDDAQRIGTELSRMHRDQSLVGYDMSKDDVKRIMSEFTSLGGFDSVRSADEYEMRAKDMIQNVRKLMQTLKVTEEEALRAIKEFNMMGGSTGFATNTAASAYAAGYTGRELIQFGQQAAEMVRGTGITMASAFIGGIDALTLVKNQMSMSSVPTELIRQYGGPEAYAASVTKMGYEWASSLSGYTQFAAASALGGLPGTYGMTPDQTIGAAVGFLTNRGVQGMLEYQGSMAQRISNQDPTVMAATRGYQFAQEMQMMGYGGANLTQESYVGYLQTRYGMGANEASALWNTLWSGKTAVGALAKKQNALVMQAIDAVPTAGAVLEDQITNTLDAAMNDPVARGTAGFIGGAAIGAAGIGIAGAASALTAGTATLGAAGTAALLPFVTNPIGAAVLVTGAAVLGTAALVGGPSIMTSLEKAAVLQREADTRRFAGIAGFHQIKTNWTELSKNAILLGLEGRTYDKGQEASIKDIERTQVTLAQESLMARLLTSTDKLQHLTSEEIQYELGIKGYIDWEKNAGIDRVLTEFRGDPHKQIQGVLSIIDSAPEQIKNFYARNQGALAGLILNRSSADFNLRDRWQYHLDVRNDEALARRRALAKEIAGIDAQNTSGALSARSFEKRLEFFLEGIDDTAPLIAATVGMDLGKLRANRTTAEQVGYILGEATEAQRSLLVEQIKSFGAPEMWVKGRRVEGYTTLAAMRTSEISRTVRDISYAEEELSSATSEELRQTIQGRINASKKTYAVLTGKAYDPAATDKLLPLNDRIESDNQTQKILDFNPSDPFGVGRWLVGKVSSIIDTPREHAAVENIKATGEQFIAEKNKIEPLTVLSAALAKAGSVQQKAAWLDQDPMMAVQSVYNEANMKNLAVTADLLKQLFERANNPTAGLYIREAD